MRRMVEAGLEWIAARSESALSWLGLSTASWALVLGCEQLVQGGAGGPFGTALYLLSRSLALSALFSLWVAAVHVALQLLGGLGDRRFLVLGAGLCAVAAAPAHELSAFLTEGAWIADHPHVRAVQIGMLLTLLAGWSAVWAFHVLGTSPSVWPRFGASTRVSRGLRGSWWVCGLGGLACLIVLLPGVLRPYAALGERLLLPGWLLASTLGFRACADAPRLRRSASLSVLALAGCALAFASFAPGRIAGARAYALSGAGFSTYTEQRTHAGARRQLGRFDFHDAERVSCPSPQRSTPLAFSAAQRRNVILLSIDTVRRDAIGKRYGKRAVAPSLEAFAKESVAFDRAVAPASITLYSLGSALSGYSVPQLLWSPAPPPNVFARTRRAFDRQLMVLPDWNVMRRRGLTSLVTQKTPLRYVPRDKGPAKGFVADLEQARERGERVFFWLHLVDPHAPYSARRSYDFGDGEVERYHAEVAHADAQLGRVLQKLRELGYFDDSLIVVFSDHGESLGEGGYFGHGVSMAARFTDIPLYVHYPGVAPRRSLAAVSLTSVARTVLHYLDKPIPSALSGCSLLQSEAELARCPAPASTAFGIETRTYEQVLNDPVLTYADLPRRQTQVARWQRFAPDVALTSSEHRYLFDLKTGSERLYDRVRDPDERRDLIDEQPQLARAFRDRLGRWARGESERMVCRVREVAGAKGEAALSAPRAGTR
jgi:hypothetical protein